MTYWLRRSLDTNEFCHHKDGNKLNTLMNNLTLISVSNHQKLHNKDKTLSLGHCLKISESNRKRRGTKQKKRVFICADELRDMLTIGYSINMIAKHFKCDWSTIKSRIYENPELLKEGEKA